MAIEAALFRERKASVTMNFGKTARRGANTLLTGLVALAAAVLPQVAAAQEAVAEAANAAPVAAPATSEAILRALALIVLAAALADPSLVFEEREPVKDVVPVVVDRSASNRLADRSAQTDAAVAEIEQQLRGIPNVEPRIVELRDAQGSSDGTRLFEALSSSLADVPSERVAGAIAITDGLAHDTPANAEALGLRAPLHVLTTGRNAEIDRRIMLVDSPRFGIVGKDQVIRLRVVDKNGSSRAGLTIRRDGEIIARRDVATGQRGEIWLRGPALLKEYCKYVKAFQGV